MRKVTYFILARILNQKEARLTLYKWMAMLPLERITMRLSIVLAVSITSLNITGSQGFSSSLLHRCAFIYFVLLFCDSDTNGINYQITWISTDTAIMTKNVTDDFQGEQRGILTNGSNKMLIVTKPHILINHIDVEAYKSRY